MRSKVAALIVLACAGSVRAQPSPSALVLLAGVGEYFGETYTAGPVAPAEYVFFEGEPVTMDVKVANWGSGVQTFVTDAVQPSDLFVIRASRNDADAALSMTVSEQTSRELLDGREDVELRSRMTLTPADAFRWRVTIGNGDLVPGLYRVRVESHASDEAGRPLGRQPAEFVFEVRGKEDAAPAELARRVAERLTAAGEFARAKAAATELERTYPDSVAVHLIRSRIADAEGDTAAYTREIDLAREFLRQDRDRLFRQFARPGQIEDLVDSLR